MPRGAVRLPVGRLSAGPPRGTSKLTARRSKVLFFRRGSTTFPYLVTGGIVLVLSIETEPVLPTLSTFALIVAPIGLCTAEHISVGNHQSLACVRQRCIVVHRSDFWENTPAPPTLPRPMTFSDIPESLTVPSASTYIANLGYIHSALSFPSPLNVPRHTFYLGEYGVVAGLTVGAFWLFSPLSFLCL